MKSLVWGSAVVAFLAVGAFVPSGPAIPTVQATEAPCVIAGRWIDENLSILPSTLEAISAFPVLYRKLIFGRLPLGTQQSLWREHLTEVMSEPALTAEQIAFLAEARTQFDRLISREMSEEEVRALERSAREVLGDALAARAIANLGPTEVRPVEAGVQCDECECECSTWSDWCLAINLHCHFEAGISCELQEWGCGSGWIWACDGMCSLPD